MTKELKIGDKAPDFAAEADGGEKIALKALKGKKLVLYFYPKDHTSGCTKEACDFRDAHPDFRKIKADIFGVSKDSVASHDKFKEKQALTFRLLSDPEGKLCAAYGVWKEKSLYGRKFMGIERSTFLIDEEGKIAGIWRKVKVPGHVAEVLKAAKGIK